MEISKELLSEVLGSKVLNYSCNSKSIYYDYIEDGITYTSYNINIYELAHKCKKWAFDKGYILSSHKNCCYIYSSLMTFIDEFNDNSEIEAIIKACEWTRKEINK